MIHTDQDSTSLLRLLFIKVKHKLNNTTYQSLPAHCLLGWCCQNPLVGGTLCAIMSPAYQQTLYYGLQPIMEIEEKHKTGPKLV